MEGSEEEDEAEEGEGEEETRCAELKSLDGETGETIRCCRATSAQKRRHGPQPSRLSCTTRGHKTRSRRGQVTKPVSGEQEHIISLCGSSKYGHFFSFGRSSGRDAHSSQHIYLAVRAVTVSSGRCSPVTAVLFS
ncbi:hypothetical protein IF1G_00949 [Cordyceps javanica]|uniref:Uncharacterized protein n=1 Tax=Cordyceps javanica TaxID=43265 RepID=A0A545VH05_9HYPO|nr:hypothetical protein IF1G_00949 [Cordyceps javanica]